MADDLSELNRVLEQIGSLAGLPKLTVTRAARKIEALIDAQFDAEEDPYGNPWADLAASTLRYKSGPGILQETGAMRASLRVTASGLDLTATLDDPFPYHQAGTGRMPSRPILPYGGVPDSWEAAIDEAVTEELEAYELFRKAA